MKRQKLSSAKGGEDLFHLVFAAAHDERLSLVDAPCSHTAESADALVAFEGVRSMAEQVGLGEFEISCVRIHGRIVLREGRG